MTRIKQILGIVGIVAITSLIVYVNAQSEPLPELEVPDTSVLPKLAVDVNEQAHNEIVLEQIDWEIKNNPPQEEEARVMIEYPVPVEKTDTVEVTPVVAQLSSVRQRTFIRGQSGAFLIDYVKNNLNGLKLWQAFYDHYGLEVADKAAIALYYENGSLWELTTGVCSPQYQIAGDYRNCVYSDINNAGMDAGLKQINTYWQRYRIAKLGGPSCEPVNSRDITDPCTASQVQWLHNVDNNIMIALDIYSEQGFQPWIGAQRAGIV